MNRSASHVETTRPVVLVAAQRLVREQGASSPRLPPARTSAAAPELDHRVRSIQRLADRERADLESLDGALHELTDFAEWAAHRADGRLGGKRRRSRSELARAALIAVTAVTSLETTAVTSLEAATVPVASATPSATAIAVSIPVATTPTIAAPAAIPVVALRSLRRLAIARHRDQHRPTRRPVHLARAHLLHEQLLGAQTEECARLLERGLTVLGHELVRFLLRVVHGFTPLARGISGAPDSGGGRSIADA